MKRWILDHLPTIWVVAIFTFGIMLVYDHAKADDWIMKKPITYKEESKVNSAPVADVYINEISKKVEDKSKPCQILTTLRFRLRLLYACCRHSASIETPLLDVLH